ncbi:hypothetical protein Afil01_46260 [Actinorhabdospora filicis]|uniref:Uncharacterized protein n=1 Tax=Actinorhabdospora filicis TaxID=1785913 RepID=A0A9W6WAM9_9ACTN|nr:hypothetical protein [Actinorhabdospora filicis]GLZ79819.1 hypothetical protein Afil01_46260 [Actinorhabdospora filicis]
MSMLGKLTDKILSKVVPAKEAAAVCPPDCIQYREMSDGYCRYKTCCYRGQHCTWTCSAWTAWGSCH